MSPEPRFARIAAMIGDPTRARMLSVLMGGQFLAAGELAAAAGITAQTASGHIAKLLDAELVVARTQGRHRYLRLAGDEVARVLEALALVAERNAGADKWMHGSYRPLKAARTCYRHVAGELGVALFQGLLARGTLAPASDHYVLTSAGRSDLARLGLDALEEGAGSRRFAHACLDWSERRDHLAGELAVQLLAHGLSHDWLRRVKDSRALVLTPTGRTALAPWLVTGSPGQPAIQRA